MRRITCLVIVYKFAKLLGLQDVHVDPLLPDVLVFTPKTDLHDHPMVTSGRLILQVSVSRVLLGHIDSVDSLSCRATSW